MSEQQGRQQPESFIAVFMDERGEVQVGASGMVDDDLVVWEHMLRIATERIALQKYLVARAQAEQQYAQQRGGFIIPQQQ